MKILIYTVTFLIFTFLNVILGMKTGFRAGWLVFYLIWWGISKWLCGLWQQYKNDKEYRKQNQSNQEQ